MHLPGRDDLTFANVTSGLALFIALGGTSYAVATGSIGTREIANNSVRGKDIRNRTITDRDVKRNGLGGSSVKESRLGRVRRARTADTLGGLTRRELVLGCPRDTRLVSDACVETATHRLEPYGGAEIVCASKSRRVATYEETNAMVRFRDIGLAPGGELTGTVVDTTPDGLVRVLVVTNEAGGVSTVEDRAGQEKPFRCALDPTNGR